MRAHLCITRLFLYCIFPHQMVHCLTDVWVCTLYGWVHMNSYINFYNAHSLNYCRFVSHFEFLLIKQHHLHIQTSAHFFMIENLQKRFTMLISFGCLHSIFIVTFMKVSILHFIWNDWKLMYWKYMYTSKWLDPKEKTEKRETNSFLLLALSHERFLSNEIKT